MKALLLCILSIAPTCHAANWFAVFAASGCLMSAGDGITTAVAISKGAHEVNPLLVRGNTGANGTLNLPLEITGKAAVCAAPFAFRWFMRKRQTPFVKAVQIEMGVSEIGAYTFAVVNNIGVINAQEKIDAQKNKAVGK